MKKVMNGRKDPYIIKRYEEEVKADDFKYGSDKNVIVALPNEVNIEAKQSFKRPTRESIAATPRQSGARRRLGRDKVALPNKVNMVAKQSFKRLIRESITATPRQSGARRRLGRDEVVNSPY